MSVDTGGQQALPDIDFTTPSTARMYDYYLDGKDNYAADREAADKALSAVPDGKRVAWANRNFLARAVRYMAESGIDQFLDLGTGIPTSPNVHEVAHEVCPRSRVAYVDNDPLVIAHDRALLAGGDGIVAVHGDIRYPLNIITNRSVQEIIDFSRPVGVLLVAVLHFISDGERPYDSVGVIRDHLAPGSYLAISHITSEGTAPETIRTIQDAYAAASAPAVFRGSREIMRFFSGLTLASPGLVNVRQWRPDHEGSQDQAPHGLRFLGGVGGKPELADPSKHISIAWRYAPGDR
jgi:SAM-dependent methyltransferase